MGDFDKGPFGAGGPFDKGPFDKGPFDKGPFGGNPFGGNPFGGGDAFWSQGGEQAASEVVRQQSWPAAGPAELEVSIDVGRIIVHLDEQGAGSAEDASTGAGTAEGGTTEDATTEDATTDAEPGEVRVEVRHDPSAGSGLAQGISGILGWLGTQTGRGGPAELATEAVRATEITWSETDRRLVVKSPTDLPLRTVPLVVTVTAPPRSRLAARAGSGDVRVTGEAGWAAVRTGSGDATVQAVHGDADLHSGSGAVEVGPITGRARVRSGSGTVRVGGVGATTDIKSGSGEVVVDEVGADLRIRTGSGDVSVADARAGRIELVSGSGRLQVGVHPGVTAELDLTSGSGNVRSDLEVADQAPESPSRLRVRGRTGSGNVLVTRSAVAV